MAFDRGSFCQNWELLIVGQKHQRDKIRVQDNYFSKRLPYAKRRIEEMFFYDDYKVGINRGDDC